MAANTNSLRARLQALFGAELAVDRELGRGGMAAVYAAFDPALQRHVAVKLLLPELADDEGIAERFLREGRTMASLQHPHVVSVYAVRSGTHRGTGTHAIVMQFVDGRSLDALLAHTPQFPIEAAGRVLSQVAAGLQHAHDRGVVHRDVKPANVLIDRDGRALVSDFGIARRQDGSAATKTGMVLGTSDYMSPEQRSGERVTAATDQYALGVMAFEVLAGRLPFVGNLAAVTRGHMVEAPPSLREFRADVPVHVDELVQRMLAKAPEDRWPSLHHAETVLASLNTSAFRTNPSGAPVVPTSRDAGSRSVWANGGVLAAAIAAIAVIGTLSWYVLQDRKTDTANIVPPSPMAGTSGGAVAPTGAPTVEAKTPAPLGGAPAFGVMRVEKPSRNAGANMSAKTPVKSDSAPAATPVMVSSPPAPAPVVAPSSSPTSVTTTAATAASANNASANNVPLATRADARKIASLFVTMLNQRRARDVARLTAIGGDAAVRTELIKLTESAADFAVGFEGMQSTPEPWTTGVMTECLLGVEWRGGKRIIRVTVYATRDADGWHLVGFGAEPAGS